MAYIKKNLTPEQRSEIGRKAAAARKDFSNCGRKKGIPNHKPKVERASLYVNKADLIVFRRLAFSQGISVVDFVHALAEHLRAKNPEVFEKEFTF